MNNIDGNVLNGPFSLIVSIILCIGIFNLGNIFQELLIKKNFFTSFRKKNYFFSPIIGAYLIILFLYPIIIFEISSNLKNSVIEIVSNGDVLITKKGDSMLKKLFKAGLTRIRVSLYDGPHQIKIFEDIQKKNSLTDDQFMIRKRYLGPDESYGITISNRAGSVKLQNEHFKLEALKEPLKKPCYYPFYKVLIIFS